MYEADCAFAQELADAAAAVSLPFFECRQLTVDTKSDGTPVTQADRHVESAMRAMLRRCRPDDAILGEESSASCERHPKSRRRWLIDPIDGTRSFVAGRGDWRTLIALEMDGVIQLGVIDAPARGRRWWAARGTGAWTNAPVMHDCHQEGLIQLRVSSANQMPQACIAVWPTPPAPGGAPCNERAQRWGQRTERRVPGDHDLRWRLTAGVNHGALLVATGNLDGFILKNGGPWDVAAFSILVEEAGGRCTSVRDPAGEGITAVFSNALLHEDILSTLLQ